MKKKLITLIACITITTALTACGGKNNETSSEPTTPDNQTEKSAEESTEESPEDFAGMANPMVETDYEHILEVTGSFATLPEDIENPKYFLISETLGDIQYTQDGGYREMDFRIQQSAEFSDISGLYYSWDSEEDGDIYGWPCKTYATKDDNGDIHLCLVYDEANGIMYSLSTQAPDLDGYDIYGDTIALFPFDPPLENCPSNAFEDRTGKTEFASYDEIIGLLEGTESYALVHVKGYDGEVLLIADDVYDNLDGNLCTIDATAYTLKSNGIVTADTLVSSQGTAYPISQDAEGRLFTAGHWEVNIYAYGENGTENPGLMVMKYITVSEFDEEGEPSVISGFYRDNSKVTENGDDTVFYEGNEVEALNEAFEELEKTTPIGFTAVDGRKATGGN